MASKSAVDGDRWRCRRDAPARCRHGRAVAPPLAHSLPVGVGGRRGRQSVGARPCGGRAVAPTAIEPPHGKASGKFVAKSGTGARWERRGAAHRIEAVPGRHEVDAKTECSETRWPRSTVTALHGHQRVINHPLARERTRDTRVPASGHGGARAQRERIASRRGRARTCAWVRTLVRRRARAAKLVPPATTCAQRRAQSDDQPAHV